MRRFLTVILSLILVLSFSFVKDSDVYTVVTKAENISYRPQIIDLTTRTDCGFGVNVHDKGYPAYPAEFLEEQIHAVAKLGSTYIRINLCIPGDGDWTYYDQLVGLCNKYGFKIIAVFDPPTNMGHDTITQICAAIATRYNGENGRGFVDFFQVWNERDASCGKAKNGSNDERGDKESHYFDIPVEGLEDLPEWLENFKAAEKGIHCKESNSKFIFNFCHTHYGFVSYMLRNGLNVDYVGWDYYSYYPYDLERSAKDLEGILDELETNIVEKYGVNILVCETNVNSAVVPQNDRENPTLETHKALVDYMYIYYKRPWIKSVVFYELIDELNMGQTSGEAWFGLIKDGDGKIRGNGVTDEKYEKPIYKEIQKILGGDSNIKMFDRSEIDLKPYEIFSVGTSDDSNIGKDGNDDTSSITTGSIPEFNWENESETGTESNKDIVTTVPNAENEKIVEEEIIENVITPVKNFKSREITSKLPTGILIGATAGLIVLVSAVLAAYLYFSKKKSLK